MKSKNWMYKDDILERYMVDGKPWIKMKVTRTVDMFEDEDRTDEDVKRAHEFLRSFPEWAYKGLKVSDIGEPRQLIQNSPVWQLIHFTLEGRAFEVMKYQQMPGKVIQKVKGYKGGKRRKWKRFMNQRRLSLFELPYVAIKHLKAIDKIVGR